MTDEELSISDATLIARLRKYKDDLLSITADRIEALVKERDKYRDAVGILEDALQEAGDDYPGSSMQQWCRQQVKDARAALKGADHE